MDSKERYHRGRGRPINNHSGKRPNTPEIIIHQHLKGIKIKHVIDKIKKFLLNYGAPRVILKSRGKGITKMVSILDILRDNISDLYYVQKPYSSTLYISSSVRINFHILDYIEQRDKSTLCRRYPVIR